MIYQPDAGEDIWPHVPHGIGEAHSCPEGCPTHNPGGPDVTCWWPACLSLPQQREQGDPDTGEFPEGPRAEQERACRCRPEPERSDDRDRLLALLVSFGIAASAEYVLAEGELRIALTAGVGDASTVFVFDDETGAFKYVGAWAR